MRINNTTDVFDDEDCSFDNCYTEQALIFIPEVQIIFLILYGIVSLVGIVGNLFIVITVIRYDFYSKKCNSKNTSCPSS